MRIRLASTLLVAGAVTIAALVFAGDRLALEAQALLLRPSAFDGDSPEPEVTIECDKPDCETGAIFYEVVVDATGRPRAVRFEAEIMADATGRSRLARFNAGIPFLERSTRTRAAKAALAARWPAPESAQPFRAFQSVGIIPPERLPTRRVPFPETEGQAVSITLERAPSYGPYAPYAVTLDSDGDVELCEPEYSRAPGPHRSHISSAAFEALVQEFREADFFSLDDRYAAHATDGAVYYLRVRIGDQEKTVVDFYGNQVGMPRVITRLQTAVDEAVEASRSISPPQDAGAWADCPASLSKTTG